MKIRIIVIIVIGLCLRFNIVNAQSVVNTDTNKVSIVDPNPPAGPTCLDNYLSFCDNLWSVLSASLAHCNQEFAGDPDGNIECNTMATDLYLNMHGVADAMYDRCRGNLE